VARDQNIRISATVGHADVSSPRRRDLCGEARVWTVKVEAVILAEERKVSAK
jgi:hypothetical protein